MNVLVDMNLPPSWAEFLTGAGHTAVHWADEGPPNAADSALLGWASERGYVVLSADWDCAAARTASGGARPGVLVVGDAALTPEAMGGAVLAAIHRAKNGLEAGAVVEVRPETGG